MNGNVLRMRRVFIHYKKWFLYFLDKYIYISSGILINQLDLSGGIFKSGQKPLNVWNIREKMRKQENHFSIDTKF
jgi:hypothetical protein